MKFIKSHSLPNWFDKFHGKEPLTYDDVNLFISQLEDLSAFPTKSYVNFAKKLQKYNAEEIRIDTVNPNNLLIDSEFKSIDIIDVTSEDNKATKYMKRPINGLSDMEALLLDSMMFKSYYDMANDWDKVKLDKCAKTIIDKCVTAEKSANLGNCTENTKTYLESIDNKMPMEDGSTRKGRFEEFLQHFNGIIPEEYKDPKKVFQMNLYGHVIS